MQRSKALVFGMMLCLALSVMLGTVAVSQADPPNNSTCNAQCEFLGDLGLNHGECMSFCTSCTNNGNTAANCNCNFLDFLGGIGPGEIFNNFGQCIKALK